MNITKPATRRKKTARVLAALCEIGAMNNTCAWHPKRGEKNIAGDFYTIEDGCLACMLPEGEAPTPLNDDEDDTFFVRQPQTPEEIQQLVVQSKSAALKHCVTAAKIGKLE